MDLEQRFARKIDKYGRTPAAAAGIVRRRENARRIQAEVERITGFAIADIVGPAGSLKTEQ